MEDSDQFRPGGARLDLATYAALLEHLPEGIVVADDEGRLVLANHRAVHLTGSDLGEHTGQSITRALPLFHTDGSSWWQTNDPWGGLHTVSGTPESRVTTSTGHTVLLTTRHVRRADHSLQFLVMSMRDTRARDRIESEMSALIATAAHEIRSPLASVLGFSRTLRNRWSQLREDQKQWMLEAVETDADRLSRLVTELLDISRIDTGRLVLHKRPLDLRELVTERVDRLVRGGRPKDRFQVVNEARDLPLWGDSDRLAQVIDNLLDNAIRHGEGQVTARLHTDGTHTHLDISDEGPGISPAAHTLVFTRFWQADSRRRNGTGLGLYVVRGLVEAHGGQVAVLGRDHGTTLRVSLPHGLPEHLR